MEDFILRQNINNTKSEIQDDLEHTRYGSGTSLLTAASQMPMMLDRIPMVPVSYTHLTLPTKRIV